MIINVFPRLFEKSLGPFGLPASPKKVRVYDKKIYSIYERAKNCIWQEVLKKGKNIIPKRQEIWFSRWCSCTKKESF